MVHITKELFPIPNGENFILYAPLKGAIANVNGDMIDLLKRLKAGEDLGDLEAKLDPLKKLGIITDGETPTAEYKPKKDFNPTSATLIPGLDCNLRCIYCYAAAGEDSGKNMNSEVAKSTIDFIISNAISKKEKRVDLGFHGGGEPFIDRNMEMIKEAVKYFRHQSESYDLQSYVSGVTNGVFMSSETRKWVIDNFDELSISLDGPKDIQNKQRPSAKGKTSFDQVMETITYLESKKSKYNLRATITKDSVSRMPEIVEFFSSISSIDHYSFEPLFECGRCKTSKAEAPDPEDYIKYLIKSKEIASKLEKKATYSCAELERINSYYCSAVDSGFFCVLPQGDVTSCLEVCRKSDPRASVFMTGEYDDVTKEFVFYEDKIKTLRSRNVESIPNCRDCFAKYNCSGDCPSKCYTQSGSLFDTSKNDRCPMTQGILKSALLEKLKGGDKNDSKF